MSKNVSKKTLSREELIDEMVNVYNSATDSNALLCEAKVRMLKIIYETTERKETYDLSHSKDLPVKAIEIEYVSSEDSKDEIEALENKLMQELSIDNKKVA